MDKETTDNPNGTGKPKPAAESTESRLLTFGEKYGARHPAAPAVGILVIISILGSLLVTVGSNNNTRFIEILLMLLAVAGALYFSFFPPSAVKFGASLFGCLIVASILLDSPIPLRTAISRKLATGVSASPASGVPPPANSPTTETIVSFATPGTYVAVGCDETQTVRVEFHLPEGATLDSSDARWTDTSNISYSDKNVRQEGRAIVADGTLRGLPRQMILGIGNCPGGGHGTLILAGTYRLRAG